MISAFLPSRGTAAGLAAAVLSLALAACTPTYNWREIDVADGNGRAAFPDRPHTDKRDIVLGGQKLAFSLTTARVGDAVFAVGYAPWPPTLAADEAARRAVGQALMRSLYDNLRATPPTAFPPDGTDIDVHGQAAGKPVWLLARVWVRGDMLVEAVATGSNEGLPQDPAREFVHSLRFVH
jgi:hypothetical protein